MKHVYAMRRSDGAVKVGISVNPDNRRISVGYEVRLLIEQGATYEEASKETGLALATLYRDLPGGVRAIRDAAKQAA